MASQENDVSGTHCWEAGKGLLWIEEGLGENCTFSNIELKAYFSPFPAKELYVWRQGEQRSQSDTSSMQPVVIREEVDYMIRCIAKQEKPFNHK